VSEPASTGPRRGETVEPIAFRPPPRRRQVPALTARIGKLLGAVALLALVVVVLFLLGTRSLVIEVSPADAVAEVRVGGGIVIPLPGRYLLRPGDYHLAVIAEGYHRHEQVLVVTGAHDQRLPVRLAPLPGTLDLRSTPADAEVLVDGEPRGVTPLRLELGAGEHALVLQAPRHRRHEATISIAGRGREQALAVQLEPAWAPVSVRSDPAGAEVLVDGEPAGTTPLEVDVLEGARTVELGLDGYKPWRRELQVRAGEPIELPVVTLDLADAVLRIETDPPGASVLVGGTFRGRSPLRVEVPPGSRVEVRAFKDGYRTAQRQVDTGRGDQRVRLALDAELGTVVIRAQPDDAELYVDGERRGRADTTLELPARAHAIEIRRDGYLPFSTTVTPRPGVEQRIEATLKSVLQARREAVEPEIRSAAGQTLKLFRPGPLTLGASRREPGRRANEVLREVELKRPFYLALREVTNAEFRQFQAGHSSGTVQGHSLDGERQPVVRVTWKQAALFCNWLSERDGLAPFYRVSGGEVTGVDAGAVGYRLPTEAEWAWAARTRDAGALARFAWGEGFPPPSGSGNFADQSARALIGRVLEQYNDGHAVTAPVGSFAADANGLFDMAGNATEWVHDYYDIAVTAQAAVDPLGPADGQHRVVRGSSWAHASLTELRLSFRDYGDEARDDRGFRIARYLEKGL